MGEEPTWEHALYKLRTGKMLQVGEDHPAET
jgi:hypothetical protein